MAVALAPWSKSPSSLSCAGAGDRLGARRRVWACRFSGVARRDLCICLLTLPFLFVSSCSASSAAATRASSSGEVELSSRRDRDAVIAVATLVGHQLMLALEGADIAHRNLELVGDPSVGAPLPNPGPNLI